MLSRESSEDNLCGSVYHINRGQLNALQFSNFTFDDLYLKRNTRAEDGTCFLLPCVCHVVMYLGAGGVWQERARTLRLCLAGSQA